MQSFRFECQKGCVRCCEAPGVVRLAAGDADVAARHLGMGTDEFHSQYVMKGADGLFLRPVEGTRCPFLLADGCAIHEAKPTQCRLYPFWPEIVETRQSWRKTVELCPGIGKGPLIQIEDAVLRAREMKTAFPECYDFANRGLNMLGVNPYIAFSGNCREAIAFYKDALSAEVLFTQTMGDSPMPDMGPAENIMHCTLKVGDSVLMMCDDPRGGAASGGNISLAIGLNDPARAAVLFENLSAGGTVIMPLGKTFWAEAFGMVADRFGVKWMVNCDAPK